MALTNSQYDQIMRIYQERQHHRNHILRQHTEEVYSKIPAFQGIDDAIRDASMNTLRARLSNNNQADEVSLHDRIEQLRQKRIKLLVANGYPENYLNPPYYCEDCKDTGYIDNKPCHCFKQESINLIYHQSHLTDILSKENFQTFKLDYYNNNHIDSEYKTTARQNASNAYDKSIAFCKNFKEQGGNMCISGGTGTGKTFLTHCITNQLIEQGFSVIYFTAFQLFDIFQKATFHKSAAAQEDYENIFNCDLLIIDDLGTEFSNTYTNSQLFLCLNERLLRGKSVVISTNLSLKELASVYGERITSRISSEYELIKLFGADIRIQKKINNK